MEGILCWMEILSCKKLSLEMDYIPFLGDLVIHWTFFIIRKTVVYEDDHVEIGIMTAL